MAALNGMPFLVFNLGGEMLYILQQRLHAQNVAEDKSKKVLHDVISAMFAPAFITDLMRPQALYSNTSTRQVFDKLAHSSIMKLNTSSMDKLYDLMTMGFKQQVLSAARATDLFQITLNHLDSVREMIHSSTVAQLLASAHERFVSTFKDLNVGQYLIIKQTLCNWFQDRRVKVSLFLSTGLQNTDGTMVLSHKGALPEGSESPGLVRYFSDGRLLGTANVQLCNSEGVTPSVPREAYEVLDFEQRPCRLGRNLYGKDRKPKEASTAPPPTQATEVPEERSATDAARSELSLLASLVRAPAVKPDEVFSINNLFPDASSESKSSEPLSDFISFESEGYERRAAQIIEKLKGFSIESTAESNDGGSDDLLDLMDGQT